MSATAQLDRAVIENIVRQIVLAQAGAPAKASSSAESNGQPYAPNLVVSI